MIRVFKFGGACLKDAAAIKNAANIINKTIDDSPLVLVVSAMGKMTNAFEQLHKNWLEGKNTSADIEHIITFHQDILQDLFDESDFIQEQFHQIIEKIVQLLQKSTGTTYSFDQSYDLLVPYGELISSLIVHEFLKKQGFHSHSVHAPSHIFADDTWREGRINWEKTVSQIKQEILPILSSDDKSVIVSQGFIAASASTQMITLGREGSDFTASIYAYALDAESVTIWKDVQGIYNADPKSFEEVTLIPSLSYHEAVELAYYGQSVIHPKTIKPLQNKKIPLHIRSFVDINLPGSIISSDSSHDTDIPCFILKKNQVLISVSPKDFAFINEQNLGEITACLAEIRVRMNVMQNSAISFSFCADYNDFKLTHLTKKLANKYFVKYNNGLELITIRNYNDKIISKLTKGKKILLEQKSRSTAQLVTAQHNFL